MSALVRTVRQELGCSLCRGNTLVYERSLLALALGDGRDFMRGLERALDEAGDVQFRPFSISPVCLTRFFCRCSSLSLSESLDCPFPSCLPSFLLHPFCTLLSELKILKYSVKLHIVLLLSYCFVVTHTVMVVQLQCGSIWCEYFSKLMCFCGQVS